MRQSGLTPKFVRPYTTPYTEFAKTLDCLVVFDPLYFLKIPCDLKLASLPPVAAYSQNFLLRPAVLRILKWEVEVEHAEVSEYCTFVASPLFAALIP